MPYLGLKLHDLFLTSRAEVQLAAEVASNPAEPTDPDAASSSERPPPPPSRRQRLRNQLKYLLVLLYPALTTAIALGQLGWGVRYLFERTRFWSPAGLLGGWVVDRVGADDLVRLARSCSARLHDELTSESLRPSPPQHDPLPARRTLLSPLTRRLPLSPAALPALLPTLLLSLKLYEFYHSLPAFSTSPTALHPSAHPPLPPPPRAPAPPGTPTEWGRCVVCGDEWQGPTVLAGGREGGEGGWVGCWSCFWALGEDDDEGETGPGEDGARGEKQAQEGEGVGVSDRRSWWKGRVDRDRMRRVLL